MSARSASAQNPQASSIAISARTIRSLGSVISIITGAFEHEILNKINITDKTIIKFTFITHIILIISIVSTLAKYCFLFFKILGST